MAERKPEVVVALDVEKGEEARRLAEDLVSAIDFFKVGSRLFTAEGPSMVRDLRKAGARIFLDLKFHDIPATVAGSVRAATGLGVQMMTLHTWGGVDMMRAAADEAAAAAVAAGVEKPLLVGVTVLTSLSRVDLEGLMPEGIEISDLALRLAGNAKEAGLDGVVASVHETPVIKGRFGPDFLVVTPGIRPSGTDTGDQKRVATPRIAAEAGSDYLVIGRPIIQASSPLEAAVAIKNELADL
jgi:orotidine-5'-phosphate decarboxylase